MAIVMSTVSLWEVGKTLMLTSVSQSFEFLLYALAQPTLWITVP